MAAAVASNGNAAPRDFSHLDRLLERSSAWAEPSFEPGDQVKTFVREHVKILVIGAGGLGCEILQNLALLGFSDIHVIDMDTIDVSNLNRQFLFRPKDVGRPKAETAAEFVMRRVPGCHVTPYYGKIQDKDEDYYMQFHIVVCGLDSIDARRWINSTLVNMVDEENPESLKPLIDGGTEGFAGQARVILPTQNACYECGMSLHTPQTAYPICTIANTPRLPEHCIEWASVLEWPRVFGDKKLDNDDPDHIQWLYDQASARAAHYKIEGVTWSLTQGVVKNIIPAIASTNAIIAASCCNEAFKIATSSGLALNNYMAYNGLVGIYTTTMDYERNPDCMACGSKTVTTRVDPTRTLQQLLDEIAERTELSIKKPSISLGARPLYWEKPPAIEASTRANLAKPLLELFGGQRGADLTVTASGLPLSITLSVAIDDAVAPRPPKPAPETDGAPVKV